MRSFLFICFMSYLIFGNAQATQSDGSNPEDVKYKRSSLYTIMVDQGQLPNSDIIKEIFLSTPIPDKFNDHNLKMRILNEKSKDKDLEPVITRYLARHRVAKKLVAKWFNRSDKGGFNMNLIQERGNYNATEMDAAIAKGSKRGLAILADAGEELIGNTFVLVSSYHYTDKAEVAKKVNEGLGEFSKFTAKYAHTDVSGATNLAAKTSTTVGVGYVVTTTSYLYQLVWNDSVASVFYNNYWTEDANLDAARKAAFDSSDIFSLKYIGTDVAMADVQSATFLNKPIKDLIASAEKNALHKVIVKLQKNHEVFRTKTPLYTTDPLTAKIGLKEGLKAGDKYEVLEQEQDKDGITKYKKVGSIKVDKKQIWNNEYSVADEIADTTGVNRTLFEGHGKFAPGMLIKQE
jgi:hypothetical protein